MSRIYISDRSVRMVTPFETKHAVHKPRLLMTMKESIFGAFLQLFCTEQTQTKIKQLIYSVS